MGIKIYRANKNDFLLILPLFLDLVEYNCKESGLFDSWYSSRNWKQGRGNELEKDLRDEFGYFLIAKDKDIIVGYSYIFYLSQENTCVLEELYVSQKYREQGIGKVLFNKSIKWAKAFSNFIKVEVYPWNKGAINFYKNLGFLLESHTYELNLKTKSWGKMRKFEKREKIKKEEMKRGVRS